MNFLQAPNGVSRVFTTPTNSLVKAPDLQASQAEDELPPILPQPRSAVLKKDEVLPAFEEILAKLSCAKEERTSLLYQLKEILVAVEGWADDSLSGVEEILVLQHELNKKLLAALTDTSKQTLNGCAEQSLDKVLERIGSQLGEKVKSVTDLASEKQEGKTFLLQAATFGSGALFDRHKPETLQDYQRLFAAIGHAILAKLSLDMRVSELPQPLQPFDVAITNMPLPSKRKAELVSLNMEALIIRAHYLLPLRNHSGDLTVEYSAKSKETQITFSLYGHNIDRRMEFAVLYAMFAGFERVVSPDYDPLKLHFSVAWKCAPGQINDIVAFCSLLAGLSLPTESKEVEGLQAFSMESSLKAIEKNFGLLGKEVDVNAIPDELFREKPLFAYAVSSATSETSFPAILACVDDLTKKQALFDVHPLNFPLLFKDSQLVNSLLKRLMDDKLSTEEKVQAEQRLLALANWKPLCVLSAGTVMQDCALLYKHFHEKGRAEGCEQLLSAMREAANELMQNKDPRFKSNARVFQASYQAFLKKSNHG